MRELNKQNPLFLKDALNNYNKLPDLVEFQQQLNKFLMYNTSTELNNLKDSISQNAQGLIDNFIAKYESDAKRLITPIP